MVLDRRDRRRSLPEGRLVDSLRRVQRRQLLDTQVHLVQHRFGFLGQRHAVLVRVRVFLLATAPDNRQGPVFCRTTLQRITFRNVRRPTIADEQ